MLEQPYFACRKPYIPSLVLLCRIRKEPCLNPCTANSSFCRQYWARLSLGFKAAPFIQECSQIPLDIQVLQCRLALIVWKALTANHKSFTAGSMQPAELWTDFFFKSEWQILLCDPYCNSTVHLANTMPQFPKRSFFKPSMIIWGNVSASSNLLFLEKLFLKKWKTAVL